MESKHQYECIINKNKKTGNCDNDKVLCKKSYAIKTKKEMKCAKFLSNDTYDGVTKGWKIDESWQRNSVATVVPFGNWSYESGWMYKYGLKGMQHLKVDSESDALEGITLRVVTKVEDPFVMPADNALGYEGYCIDLLLQISKLLGFNFTLVVDTYQSFNDEDKFGHWSGVIDKLRRKEADLSISPMAITYSYSEVVDFSLPFMHLGISVLLPTCNENSSNQLFTFLEPLSVDVWLSLLGAYIFVAISMWFLAKLSSHEWYSIEEVNGEKIVLSNKRKNQFSITNSLWFAIGSLMQQGSDVIPRAASTRIVAVTWWLFTLVILSSYTAQLAAFLTAERMITDIENIADLAGQNKIHYGTLKNSLTMNFFRESQVPLYEKMWSVMESRASTVFVKSHHDGIERVKSGDYAYIAESTIIEYHMARNCALHRIPELLDSKGYGIAFPKHSPLRNIFSRAILKLQESTFLEALKNSWWTKKNESTVCNSHMIRQGTSSSLENIIGIFYVLIVSAAIAFVIALLEYVIESRNDNIRTNLTLLGRIGSWWSSGKESNLKRMQRKFQNLHLDDIAVSNEYFAKQIDKSDQSISEFMQAPKLSAISYVQLNRLNRLLPMSDEILYRRRLSVFPRQGSAQSQSGNMFHTS